MPQIDQLFTTYSSQIFWLLIIFGLVYFVIGRGMVPKVTGTVDLRDKQIGDDLAAAEAARAQADKEEEAWRARENENRANAQALVGEAKAQAAATTERELAAAQSRLDARLAEAEARIEASRSSAAAGIEDVAADAAQDIARRIAGLEVSEPAARSAVKDALAHG